MLPTPPDKPSSPELRIADDDRFRVVDALRVHCADGRIDLDEFAERVGVALAARTSGELAAVVADLPDVAVPPEPVGATTVTTGRRRRPVRWTVAFMSGSRRRGRWRLEGRTSAVAMFGGARLDLRDAEISGDEVVVTAVAVMGGVQVIVPEGVAVEVTGLAVMGGRHNRVRDVPVLPGTPLVRVRAFAFWGGVHVESRERGAGRSGRRELRSGRGHEHRDRHRHRGRELGRGGATLGAADGTVTIVVTDIVGSTERAESMGDLGWREVLRRHERLVRGLVGEHGGSEVKAQGDGFLLAFPSARRALLFAAALQQELAEQGAGASGDGLRVRMGLHTGEVVSEGGDVFGRTVILASRLAAAAEPGEVAVTALVKELTESAGDLRFREGREVELKGLAGTHQVWSLDW